MAVLRPRVFSRATVALFTSVALAVVVLAGTASPVAAEEYVVMSGDSLSTIARDHGVAADELASANGLSDLHLIRVGQSLTIPRPEPVTYVVASGDSLSIIARDHGVAADELASANGLSDLQLIRVGQELTIPSGGTVSAGGTVPAGGTVSAGGTVPTGGTVATAAVAAAPVDPAAGYNSLPGRLRDHPERLKLIPVFEQWADHYGVPRDLLMAMAYRESGWQEHVVSNKGAVGIGQLMPATSEWVANDLIKADLDPRDPEDNIRMSARLMQWLIGFMGSEEGAMAAYYQGQGSVAARGLFTDTQEYIDNIGQIRRLFVKG